MIDPGTTVLVAIDENALARWVVWLAEAIEKRFKAEVAFAIDDQRGDDGDSALATLLSLESLLLRPGRKAGADRLARADIAGRLPAPGLKPAIVIDLTTAGFATDAARLRPLYNGRPGETALAATLFFEGTPKIEIESIPPGATRGPIVAHGVASLEAAAGIGGGIEAVGSRVITLVLKALAGQRSAEEGASPQASGTASTIGRRDILLYSAKSVARQAVRAAYRLCCHGSHWRVGWRFVQPGHDVWTRRDLSGVRWSVLPDPVDHFYADPFPLHRNGRDYLFFEDLDYKTGKGVISVVAFDETGRPGPTMTVLEEPWHLSYPFLIEWNGDIWMIPESSANRDIAIYRAVDFPMRWERHEVLVSGVEAADATIVSHHGRLWMFAVVRDGVGGYSDTLALWSAEDLFGAWRPHAGNPVLVDDRMARPAGNMIHRDGQLYRPVQDCRHAYGASLNLMRVSRLDDEGFEQELEDSIGPGAAWPGRRLHTLNYNGRLETIDGFVLRPRLKPAADLVDAWFKPKG